MHFFIVVAQSVQELRILVAEQQAILLVKLVDRQASPPGRARFRVHHAVNWEASVHFGQLGLLGQSDPLRFNEFFVARCLYPKWRRTTLQVEPLFSMDSWARIPQEKRGNES